MSIPVALYRLDTGRIHRIQVPPYLVLRRRTVERLREGLGFRPHMVEWNRERFEPTLELGSELGVDTPQVFELGGRLMVLETDWDCLAEIAPGSIPVKIRAARVDEIRLLTRLIAEQISGRCLTGAPETDAAKHVAALLERLT